MAVEEDNPEGKKIGNRFIVQKYLAGGSFGRLYIGKNISTGEMVAIKMEKMDVSKAQLPFEFRFFKLLKATSEVNVPHRGIPKIHFFGPCSTWNALVMDLLGPSLEDVHQNCGGLFSLKTTLMLTFQLIEIFEYFHGKGLIYRDMKPENFLFGQSGTDKYSVVHIIDLGLSKEYMENGQHIKFRNDKGMTGTVRYVSINSHKGLEISRRDDMEALGYMIVFFIKGELPWMGLKAKDVQTKYSQIGKLKRMTKPEQLCSDIAGEFTQYLKDVRELAFEEEPKYRKYITLFTKVMERNGLKNDGIYDFDKNHKPKRN